MPVLAIDMDHLLKALQAAATLYASDEKASAPEAEKPWMTRPLPWAIIEPVVAAIDGVPEILALTHLSSPPPW